MSNEGQYPPPPPAALPGTAPAKKSRLPIILGVIVALLVVRWMFSGPSKATGSPTTADAGSSSAPDTSGNPVIGEWVLTEPEKATYCPTYQKFTASKSIYTENGKTVEATPIYDIKPGVTVVGYGGSYMGEWRPTGPDDMTLGQVGPPPYGVPSFCNFHRK